MADITVYYSVDLSETQRLMLYTQVWRGREYVHLRLWWVPKGEEKFRAGKGLTMPKNSTILAELADGMHDLAAILARGGSFSPELADNTDENQEPEEGGQDASDSEGN